MPSAPLTLRLGDVGSGGAASDEGDSGGNSNFLGLVTAARSANVPAFDSCGGVQLWPSASSGTPYSNSGSTVAGIPQIAGTITYQGNDHYNPNDGIFVPFDSWSSDGTVITTNGSIYASCQLLPCTVYGDFTASYDAQAIVILSQSLGFMLLDQILNKSVWCSFNNGSPSNLYSNITRECVFTTQAGEEILANDGTGLPLGGVVNIKVKRVGTVITMYLENVPASSYDFGVVFGVQPAIIWLGDSQFQFKNISVTTP